MKKMFFSAAVIAFMSSSNLFAANAHKMIMATDTITTDSVVTDSTKQKEVPVKAEAIAPSAMHYGMILPNDTLNTGGQQEIKYVKIEVDALPEAVKKTLGAEYTNYTVKEAYASDQATKTYRVVMTDKEETEVVVIFSEEGKVL